MFHLLPLSASFHSRLYPPCSHLTISSLFSSILFNSLHFLSLPFTFSSFLHFSFLLDFFILLLAHTSFSNFQIMLVCPLWGVINFRYVAVVLDLPRSCYQSHQKVPVIRNKSFVFPLCSEGTAIHYHFSVNLADGGVLYNRAKVAACRRNPRMFAGSQTGALLQSA